MTQGEMFSDLALEQQYDNMIKKLGMKQETLEEVAERILANNIDGLRDALKDDDLFFFYKGVVQCYGEAMAKWQQERSYSEEEVIAFGEFIFKHTLLAHSKGVKNLFEQFKKK